MTNHAPVFTSSSATVSFTETANTTDSTTLHQLSGTMTFKDSDKTDTHTTSVSLSSAVLSSGSIIPTASLTNFQTAMTSQILTDSNGSGSLQWTFADADEDFDFLAKNQTLTLTYSIKVSDNQGGFVYQTVKVVVTGTDDKPAITIEPVTIVSEQADQTLSPSPDVAHIALDFTDEDLTNTGHTASVTAVSASGNTAGLLPGSLGTAELMAFFHVDNVVKTSGSSTGTINTTFAAPDLAFDYLAAGEQLNITYTVQLDDHAGGLTTQTVNVTVVGTNDAPVYLCGPEVVHLTEDQDVSPAGDLTAQGDLLFSDIDLSDTHTVSTTVTASRSGGGSIPLSDAALLAAFHTTLDPDSTGHVVGDVDWNFALANNSVSFLSGGETLTLTYHLTVTDPSGATATQDVTVTILGSNHPVVIDSGPQTASAEELADTTGSAAIDTTTTLPSGTLAFHDTDTSDSHTVTVTLDSTLLSSGGSVPGATQTDLAAAVTTVLNDSTGTGTGSIDWTFAIADHDVDFLSAGETLTINYNVAVSDSATTSTQTVSVTVVGANDAVAITSGPGSASVTELANTTDSPTLDETTPVPTGSLAFDDVDLSDVHSVGVTLTSAVWSADPLGNIPVETLGDLQAALATVLHDSTGSGAGSVDWSFAIPDRDLDFLSAGETLTVTYDVSVSDGFTTSTQTVTITVGGADDALVATPVSVAVVDTPFIDAGAVVASGQLAELAHPIDQSSTRSVTEVNSDGANVGQPVVGTYGTLFLSADGLYSYTANSAIDPLQGGDNVSDQFTFTIADNHGNTTTTTLTVNIAGDNDNPDITAATASGSVTEDAGPSVLLDGGFENGTLGAWTTTGSGVQVEQLEFGGGFGHYTAHLTATAGATLSQDVSTTPGQHYFLSFTVIGDTEASSSPLSVSWDGTTLLSLSNVPLGVNNYTFEVVGDASLSTTSLQFSYSDDGSGLYLDQIGLNPATGPATESTDGSISFSDVETADTHTASFTPLGSGYVGTFSLDAVSEAGGSGSVAWHYSVDNADIQFLAAGQSLTQDYLVSVNDDHGGSTAQVVSVTLVGTNDAPTAVGETVISDAGTPGLIDIPTWALAMNDTDPDTTDHVSVNSIGTSSGGDAIPFGDIFFSDNDATPGGSFTYNVTDGTATSNNFATATVVNNPTSSTALVGTSGDDIIIATGASETMSGGGGNDVLIGASGSHVMDGGSGNDSFAFLNTSAGPGVITDFNNTTESDHIVISGNGFGGGLTAGMDVTSLFETSADDQFSGAGTVFHFDTANQTLYFSADGTQASAVAVTTVQTGVVLSAHDLLIV